jgi:serine/threonine-protein kinase HipA
MSRAIYVHADWEGLAQPLLLGTLHARQSGRDELFEFEFTAGAIAHPALQGVSLDPRLGIWPGPQFPPKGRASFGMVADSSPDRWGQLLMKRRAERNWRASGNPGQLPRLHASDYLMGVHDQYRVGALRYSLAPDGPFLDNQRRDGAPPLVMLRELEAASLAFEESEQDPAAINDDQLRLLIAPGGSLGGARPKASVVDERGQLYIAKFPSTRDRYNVGAWEGVVNYLAEKCAIEPARGGVARFASAHHTFIVQRFDRTEMGRRLHFASAMTLTDKQDGDDASTGASYLDIATVLITQGARPNEDLRLLWSRMVFDMLVSNSDGHLRNTGFILQPGKGWQLSQAYDINPDPGARELKLNVSETDNAMDLDLALSVAPIFRVAHADAKDIIGKQISVVRHWRALASSPMHGLSARELERMAPAFRLAG